MKIKALLAVAIAAVTFASCSKEEGADNNKAGELARVTINMEQPGTRATGATQAAQAVSFTSGYVYFVDNDSKITNIFRLVSGTPTPDTNEIKIGTSMTFDEVSGNSQHVYIFGNIPAQTAAVGANISTVANAAVNVKTQTDDVDDSTLDNYYLFGKTATPINHNGANSTASVTVKPIGSRIEIGELKAVDKAGQTENVTAFRVDGIFINNTYKQITLAGAKTATAADFFYNGKEADGQSPVNFITNGTHYPTADQGYLYNANETAGIATSASNVAKPASGVWAYNVFAPTAGEFPHVVIRVSNIAGVTAIPASEIRWMTITKFLKTGDSSEITSFEPGKIYKITSLEFNAYDHLDVSPEMKTVTAVVTVSVPDWSLETVKPW
jgi:hypothetical protein